MREFVDAALGFPTGIFTVVLSVVVVHWLLVLCGGIEHDMLDTVAGSAAFGAVGVPAAVSVSVFTVVAWFTSLAGTVLADRLGFGGGTALVMLVAVLLLAGFVTRALVRPLRAVFRSAALVPSRQDFIGMTCVIRTSRVDHGFGQAEVASDDGSTAVVQVRQTGSEPLTYGSTALLFAYDEPGEFFWAAPFDAALDPRSSG
ncbi:hypothetical protein [Streptomyces bambusae]|uniref:DUF1449 family protein n=1 Tax=Streptomyces bambusae TaxID=1550616 RepID=A0ABS6Z1U8_9ACTN|nr:hypothetical protein [Streptomyces bambusae]MBW5480786.1 hypothetical protein [Streptomyces bambusae]